MLTIVSILSDQHESTRKAHEDGIALFAPTLTIKHIVAQDARAALAELETAVPTMVICPLHQLQGWKRMANPHQIKAPLLAIGGVDPNIQHLRKTHPQLPIFEAMGTTSEHEPFKIPYAVLDVLRAFGHVSQQTANWLTMHELDRADYMMKNDSWAQRPDTPTPTSLPAHPGVS